jgi:hypothetical protein
MLQGLTTAIQAGLSGGKAAQEVVSPFEKQIADINHGTIFPKELCSIALSDPRIYRDVYALSVRFYRDAELQRFRRAGFRLPHERESRTIHARARALVAS